MATKPKRRRPVAHSENVRAAQKFMRCHEAFQKLCEGKTYAEIAQEMGWRSRQAVHDALKRYKELVAQQDNAIFVLKQVEQLRMMTELNMLNAQNGDCFAIQTQIRIQEREARLLGFDAPTKHEVTGKDGQPLTPAGILVVPAVMSEEEWAKQAAAQQEELTKREQAAAGHAST